MRSLPVIITALLVGILGTILVLGFLGIVPIFGRKANQGPVAGPGQKLVPVSVASIPAYSQVSREHVFNTRTMTFMEVPVTVSEMPDDTIYDRSKIIGRVLARSKKPFTSFQEDDFLPEGTAAGISGAIEPGKRAIVVEADRIQGVQGLNQGDHFDLLMALPGGARVQEITNIVSPNSPPRQGTADTVLVVNNGQVISGVTERKEEYKKQEGVVGATTYKERTIREISLAVAPNEVVMLTKALAGGQQLIAVVRSGRPGAATTDTDIQIPIASNVIQAPTAAPAPVATPKPFVIDEIRGKNRGSASFQ